MGCVFSGSLAKTSKERKYPLNPSYQHQAVVPDQGVEEPGAGGVRPYWSFTYFLLQNDNSQIFEWSFGEEIGKGAMSRVFMCENTETGEVSAAKVYNANILNRPTLGNEESLSVAVQREIEIMFVLQHRYVLQGLDVIEGECSNLLIIFMPFARHGALQSFVDNNTMDENL
jgi:serine/threonine protein kinase